LRAMTPSGKSTVPKGNKGILRGLALKSIIGPM